MGERGQTYVRSPDDAPTVVNPVKSMVCGLHKK